MVTKGPKSSTPRGAAPRAKAVPPKPAAPAPVIAAAPVEAIAPTPKPSVLKPVVEAAEKAADTAKATVQNVAAPVTKAAETIVKAVAGTVTDTAKAVAAAAAPTAQTVQKETAPMTDLKTAADTATHMAQAMFGDMNDRAKTAMEKSAKLAEEMNDFAKGNLEAMVESGRIAAKGVETLGQEAAEYSRKSFEHATAAMKSMASVKSPTELFKLQSDYVRSAFDAYVAEASKATEHMLKLSSDAMQPLSNRMAVAAEKVKVVA